MTVPISESEVQFALSSIERRRQQVVAEINVPTGYWIFLASGWVLLGVLVDFRAGLGHHRGNAAVRSGPRRHIPSSPFRASSVSATEHPRRPREPPPPGARDWFSAGHDGSHGRCCLRAACQRRTACSHMGQRGRRSARPRWRPHVGELGAPTRRVDYRLTWPRPSSMSSSIQVHACRSSPCWHRPIGPSSPS